MDTSLAEGFAGWDYLVRDGGVEYCGSAGLSDWSSVFQAEITAITKLAQPLVLHKFQSHCEKSYRVLFL